jgi:hypothetical protein
MEDYQMKSSNDYIERLQSEFVKAITNGFLAFPEGVNNSNSLNSTPFVTSFLEFSNRMDFSLRRKALLVHLAALITEISERGMEPQVLMIGGSFLDASNPSPNDIDCVIFYRSGVQSIATAGQWMSTIRDRAKAVKLDARFVPTDGNLIVLLRSAIYFASLYRESKNGANSRGVVLLDCSDFIKLAR